jgi:hypothetical protein
MDAPYQILGGVAGRAMHVMKANQVGNIPIAKKYGHTIPNVRLIQHVALPVSKFNTGFFQYAFIGSHPSEPEPGHDTCDIVGYRTFRRPQSLRVSAEPLIHEFARPPKLLLRILGKPEYDGHISIVDLTVDQQRKYWMIERRRGYLDGSFILTSTIFRYHVANGFQYKTAERNFVGLIEPASLLNQLLRPSILIHPGQGPPHLDIAKILFAVSERIAPFVKFEVSGIRLQHGCHRNGKEPLSNHRALGMAQVRGRLECKIQHFVPCLIARILLQLQHQRRNEVERLMNLRKFARKRGHSKVILRGMQVSPGHHISISNDIFVERLMHVPQE